RSAIGRFSTGSRSRSGARGASMRWLSGPHLPVHAAAGYRSADHRSAADRSRPPAAAVRLAPLAAVGHDNLPALHTLLARDVEILERLSLDLQLPVFTAGP